MRAWGAVGLVGVLFAALFLGSSPPAVSTAAGSTGAKPPVGPGCTTTAPIVCLVNTEGGLGQLQEACLESDPPGGPSRCNENDFKIPLQAALTCATDPGVVNSRADDPDLQDVTSTGMLCLFDLDDRDEPFIARCVPVAGGVDSSNRASCQDSDDDPRTRVDPAVDAEAVAWCRPLTSTQVGNTIAHDLEWACSDRDQAVYACTSRSVFDRQTSYDKGLRPDTCTSRTFPAGTLTCQPTRPDNTATCTPAVSLDREATPPTLTCALFTDPTPESSSNVYNRPMHCAHEMPLAPVDGSPTTCGTTPASTPGHNRGLTATPGDPPPSTTLTQLCAAAAPGSIARVTFADGVVNGDGELVVPLADAQLVVEEMTTMATIDPASSLSTTAMSISTLQEIIDQLQVPDPDLVVAPIPLVLISDQVTSQAAHSPDPDLIMLNSGDATDFTSLAHEYAHILADNLDFAAFPDPMLPEVEWQVDALHEGFADAFAWLSNADSQTPPSRNYDRMFEQISYLEVGAAHDEHHNGVVLLNVMQHLQNVWNVPTTAEGVTRDGQLRQMLVDSISTPAVLTFGTFRDELIEVAVSRGIPRAIVEDAFNRKGWLPVNTEWCAVDWLKWLQDKKDSDDDGAAGGATGRSDVRWVGTGSTGISAFGSAVC